MSDDTTQSDDEDEEDSRTKQNIRDPDVVEKLRKSVDEDGDEDEEDEDGEEGADE